MYIIKMTYTGETFTKGTTVYLGTDGTMSTNLDDFGFRGRYWRNAYRNHSTAQRVASKWANQNRDSIREYNRLIRESDKPRDS